MVSSHILLLHDDSCMPLITHHEVRDPTIHREVLDLGSSGFFVDVLSRAELLLHLRSFSILQLLIATFRFARLTLLENIGVGTDRDARCL